MRTIPANFRFFLCFFVGLAVFSSGAGHRAHAQQDDLDEVFLMLHHPAVGKVYVTAMIRDDVPFLPLGELLSLLEIPSRQILESKGYEGAYPMAKDTWQIDPVRQSFLLLGKSQPFTMEDIHLGETDLYLHPRIFSEAFGLTFTMNLSILTLSMEARYPLPIVEKKRREQIRTRTLSGQNGLATTATSLLYPRDRQWLRMGMVDYHINHALSEAGPLTTGLLHMGLEAFGGDVSGMVQLNHTEGRSIQGDIRGVRWRYVLPGALDPSRNVALTTLSVGDVFTTGQSSVASIVGISLSNDPVVPREEMDFFIIDGYTQPDSEVEMLMGGQLIDFTRSDEVGYYRFHAPINFGTLRLSIRIYTPQGQVIVEDRQIPIPFTFLPRGFVTYNVQAGLPRVASDSLGSNLMTHADVAYGISNSLTVRAGTDYDFSRQDVTEGSYLGLSARLFQQYLLNADFVSDRYVEANASAFLPNNTNFTAQYKSYFANEYFNPLNQTRDFSLNYFMPFRLFGRFSGLRLGGVRQETERRIRTNMQADFNTQLGRVVARINYRGNLNEFTANEEEMASRNLGGLVTSSLTYTLSRSPGVPVYVRGMFLRGQWVYNPYQKIHSNWNVLLSQTLFKRGRFTFGYERNLLHRSGRLQVGFLYDFNFMRTASQYQHSDAGYQLQQSISGSLAYDPLGILIPNNRDQVNRAGVAIKFFIDDNDNGLHDPGEEVVPAKAARLDRSATALMGSDGILRLSQLQSYWTYRLDIDRNALPDPTLAPKRQSFSFVADPNQYRMIEVPLYRTGVIDGTVYRLQADGTKDPAGGIRLQLTGENGHTETLRTFSDGGFYAYDLIPGTYRISPDAQQLAYLEKEAIPAIHQIEIRAVSDGDFIEGLDFVLKDTSDESESTSDPSDFPEGIKNKFESMINTFRKAQELAYLDQWDEALLAINESLRIFVTDQGLALKGSIYYVLGDKELALYYWKQAVERNPSIVLPTIYQELIDDEAKNNR